MHAVCCGEVLRSWLMYLRSADVSTIKTAIISAIKTADHATIETAQFTAV